MSDQTSYISQIKTAEAEAAKSLESAQKANDERIAKATEEADAIIVEAEKEQREASKIELEKAKEDAKAAYSKMLVEADNERRDIVEGGKTRIEMGKTQVVNSFMEMFK